MDRLAKPLRRIWLPMLMTNKTISDCQGTGSRCQSQGTELHQEMERIQSVVAFR